MPQFDQVSFLNQIFWLFFFFFNFYFLITYYFLPYLCEIFKFRKKKVIANNTNYQNLKIESSYQLLLENKIWIQIFTFYETTLNNISDKTFEIIKSSRYKIFNNFNSKSNLENFWIQISLFSKKFN